MTVFLGLVTTLFASDGLLAHDFWIEPSTFRPAVGSSLSVRLRVGEHFSGDPFPRDPSHIKRFVMAGPTGEVPVLGLSGSEPAGSIRVQTPGLYVIGYRSNRRLIDMDAEKFDSYLREEGLEKIRHLRAQKGHTEPDVKEAYSRCSKSLVAAGKLNPTAKDLALGFTLELVAERNPYLLTKGKELPIRLLYNAKPLQGALVVAQNQQDPTRKLKAHSDEQGRVVFLLPRSGIWLIKVVHMVPAFEDAVDWESFWASLTFELPD